MATTAAQRQRAYEERLREKGLERLQAWVPKRHIGELRGIVEAMNTGAWKPADRPEDDVAALMAEMRARGDTWMQVASKLNSQGIKPVRGEYWTESSAQKYGRRRGVK